jgi:predicted nucleic acid-binding Zn ribbon protein
MSSGGARDLDRGGAKRFGDVMKRLLRAKRFYQKSKYGPLVTAWEEVVGEEIASRTRIGAYEHGRLTIQVDSSVLMQELSGFLRSTLLQELRRKPAGQDVVDLRVTLAGGSESAAGQWTG